MFVSFHVSPEEVRAHAGTVDQLAQRMLAATKTADPSLSTDAFGIFGSFLASFLLKSAGQSQDIFGQATETIADMCQGLREVADLYENVDLDNAFGFNGKARG
ncbi:type VII secretion target [Saccharothrix variisporea]|uniref:Excreted virulence factor EspC (Type VII ESX diderm) n=1 Tax=Saccharothrix variisporea TaxID=543527 RepID=A0A495XAD1_9PSEU|nr:type VII secretion target [Saccharothrix variisporea]RKT70962.1 excreted virulence factor EspC (type VII ESX diderm) [Saccharothrix variisporea]